MKDWPWLEMSLFQIALQTGLLLLIMLVLLFVAIGIMEWILKLILVKRATKLYWQRKDFEFTYHYQWDDEWIYGRSQNGEGKRRWVDYHAFYESDHYFLLYLGDNLFEVLPKAWFEDVSERTRFAQKLRGYQQKS